MNESDAIIRLSAIAQPTRLAAVRALVEVGADGMRSSQIAHAIGTPHNTMSVHLAVLARAGLVTSIRRGREMIYRVEPSTIVDLGRFLSSLAEPA